MAAMMHAAFQAKHVCQECVNAEQLLLAQGSLLDHIATQQIMFANVLRLLLLVVEQLTPVLAVNANAVQMLRVAIPVRLVVLEPVNVELPIAALGK